MNVGEVLVLLVVVTAVVILLDRHVDSLFNWLLRKPSVPFTWDETDTLPAMGRALTKEPAPSKFKRYTL